ncbi:MAG TPA: cytochrome c peroxidase [Steroidobacteraceae bacterium]|nr:cytochrome c peroxidase [Steroidobacteraceae bacterium]
MSLLAALAVSASPGAHAGAFEWNLPAGFAAPVVPADNPMSEAKVALGRALFADPRLSISGRHSCQSCHDPARAFTDGLPRSRGAQGDTLPLNAPTLFNVAYNASYGWREPKIRTLEQQMRGPLFNEHPRELGLAGREAVVTAQLGADARLRTAFRDAFPDDAEPVSMRNIVRAIAAFERTLIRGGSPFDRYVFEGDHSALDAPQKRGMQLFFAGAGCSACHGGINFSGPWTDAAHPAAEPAFADVGTGVAVRVPTLRNLGATAPYLHDGRLATLEAVLDNYEKVAADASADPRLRRAPLTTEDRAALLAFLRSLDSSQR